VFVSDCLEIIPNSEMPADHFKAMSNAGSKEFGMASVHLPAHHNNIHRFHMPEPNTKYIYIYVPHQLLVWRSGNGAGHINKVKPCWVLLVLGLVTTFGGNTIPVFSRPLKPNQPCCPYMGRCNEYWRWFWPDLGKKRRVLCSSKVKGLPRDGPRCLCINLLLVKQSTHSP